MNLREAVGQLFLFGFDGREVSPSLDALLRDCHPGGLILFARNVGSPEEVATLTSALHAASATPLFLAIDQEGGRVSRLGSPFTQWPSASAVGEAGSVALTHALGVAMAKELAAVGINMNLAPVLDVLTNPANPVMADRTYGADPWVVAEHGMAFFMGHREIGVLAVGKHFPGHGDTAVDSHLGLPVVPHGMDRLRATELVPFIEAINGAIPGLMTAHVLCPALDPERPATLSQPILTDLLRDRLGFSGLLISDDLLMRGIADSTPPGEAAVQFLEAGGDLVLICEDEAAQRGAVACALEAARSGRLSEARLRVSLDRISGAKARYARRTARLSPEAIRRAVGCEAHRRLSGQLNAGSRKGCPAAD